MQAPGQLALDSLACWVYADTNLESTWRQLPGYRLSEERSVGHAYLEAVSRYRATWEDPRKAGPAREIDLAPGDRVNDPLLAAWLLLDSPESFRAIRPVPPIVLT